MHTHTHQSICLYGTDYKNSVYTVLQLIKALKNQQLQTLKFLYQYDLEIGIITLAVCYRF